MERSFRGSSAKKLIDDCCSGELFECACALEVEKAEFLHAPARMGGMGMGWMAVGNRPQQIVSGGGLAH